MAFIVAMHPAVRAQRMSPRAIARRVDSAMIALKGMEYTARFERERPGRDTIDAAGFLRRRGIGYQTLLRGRRILRRYQVEVFPTIYVIGRDGKILYAHVGYDAATEPELDELLNRVADESGR